MSDLVGNPEDRFSRVEAHFSGYYGELIAQEHNLAEKEVNFC